MGGVGVESGRGMGSGCEENLQFRLRAVGQNFLLWQWRVSLCWTTSDSAVLGQAPISTASLHKLHKRLTRFAENLKREGGREGEREGGREGGREGEGGCKEEGGSGGKERGGK